MNILDSTILGMVATFFIQTYYFIFQKLRPSLLYKKKIRQTFKLNFVLKGNCTIYRKPLQSILHSQVMFANCVSGMYVIGGVGSCLCGKYESIEVPVTAC